MDSFTATARAANTADYDDAEAYGAPLKTMPGVAPAKHRDQLAFDLAIITINPG